MAFLAIDSEAKSNRFAGGDHARPHGTARSAFEAQHDGRIVLELAQRHEGRKIGGELLDFKPGDEAREMIGVSADIGDDATWSCRLWIGAPSLFDAFLFERHRQPAEREF